MKRSHSFFRRNGLSIIVLALMLFSFTAQFITGFNEKNKELTEEGQPPVNAADYARSGHFIQATFENWQSEFLAVASIVILSIWLRQKGSPESKPVDAPHHQTGC